MLPSDAPVLCCFRVPLRFCTISGSLKAKEAHVEMWDRRFRLWDLLTSSTLESLPCSPDLCVLHLPSHALPDLINRSPSVLLLVLMPKLDLHMLTTVPHLLLLGNTSSPQGSPSCVWSCVVMFSRDNIQVICCANSLTLFVVFSVFQTHCQLCFEKKKKKFYWLTYYSGVLIIRLDSGFWNWELSN